MPGLDNQVDSYVLEPERKIRVRGKYQVIVVGGGPAGLGAAIAAARNGARTLLVERYGILGGMFTAGLVMGFHTDKLVPLRKFGEERPLIGGIAEELFKTLIKMGGSVEPAVWLQHTKILHNYLPVDPELLKIAGLQMVKDSGAGLLLHSLGVGAVVEKGKVGGVLIESKSGREALLAEVVIDATGDADIAARAGVPHETGGKTLPMTLLAFLGNVDLERAKEYYPGSEALNRIMDHALKQGLSAEATLPEFAAAPLLPIRFVCLPPEAMEKYWPRSGETHGRVANYRGDGTNVEDLTRAEVATREKLIPMINFLKRHVPGYEKCYLVATGAQVGVRESRRIIGEYVLTAQGDIARGRKHPDNICRATRNRGNFVEDAEPPFDIPYRCLIPPQVEGLLVAGRCISMDQSAGSMIAIRDGIQVMGIGQAAGTAAALSLQKKAAPRELDVRWLQSVLVSQGMNL